MDSNFYCEDSNHSISSWNNLNLKFTASRSPEIVPGVSDTEAAKAATGKAAAESTAMLRVDEDKELETAYDTEMLDCQRVAVRIARAWHAKMARMSRGASSRLFCQVQWQSSVFLQLFFHQISKF